MKFRPLLLLVLTLSGVVLLSASCRKSYICHCVIVYSGQPGLPDTTVQEYNITDTKSGAKSKCSGQSGTYNNNGITTVETCYLY